MSNFSSKRRKSQELGKDTAPKRSSSGDNPLTSPLGSQNPESQDSNTSKNPSEPKNEYELTTDTQKLSEVHTDELQRAHTDELQRTRTDELQRAHTDELKEEKKHKFPKRPKKQQDSDSAALDKNTGQFEQIDTENSLDEERERHKKFQSDLNKLALFAYEAEEGAEMLESGQIPFLEEVDRMLQETDSESEPLLEKENEESEQRKQQKKQKNFTDSGYAEQQEQWKKRRDSRYLE